MFLFRFLKSTVGLKVLMGVSGGALFLFLIIHMLGNLQVFIGKDALNAYAALLKMEPALLIAFRLGLLSMAIIHVISALTLYLRNKKARGPIAYKEKKSLGATLASRTMLLSGLTILGFIVYHILHFTARITHPYYSSLVDEKNRFDVYAMVVDAFSQTWISSFYIVSVGLLCYHLSHGLSSMFRSLGLSNRGFEVWQNIFAYFVSITIFLGMSIVPFSIWIGWIK